MIRSSIELDRASVQHRRPNEVVIIPSDKNPQLTWDNTPISLRGWRRQPAYRRPEGTEKTRLVSIPRRHGISAIRRYIPRQTSRDDNGLQKEV